jgi:thiopurine S-methyltransferase
MGQIGFHQSAVDRHLERFWPDLGLASASHAFVPLCGKSLDILWLHAQGHVVSGVELSAVALESFCMEHGIPSRRRILDDFDMLEAEQLRLFRGDIFALTPELLGSVSAVYDRAALISWKPELRAAYVDRMAALTSPGTKTLLVTMEYPSTQMKGPPFSVSADDVERLYSKNHSIQRISKQDILANEPRLRSRGLTQLYEACYGLTRM